MPLALKAFLVEDNATVRENLVSALEELTCVRVVGTCGAEEEAQAWVAAADHAWDLLILDLFLTSGSGMSLLSRLPRRKPNQKVVVFSNFANAAVRKRCAQLGVDAVFDKSTEIDALVDYCARQCTLKRVRVQPGSP